VSNIVEVDPFKTQLISLLLSINYYIYRLHVLKLNIFVKSFPK